MGVMHCSTVRYPNPILGFVLHCDVTMAPNCTDSLWCWSLTHQAPFISSPHRLAHHRRTSSVRKPTTQRKPTFYQVGILSTSVQKPACVQKPAPAVALSKSKRKAKLCPIACSMPVARTTIKMAVGGYGGKLCCALLLLIQLRLPRKRSVGWGASYHVLRLLVPAGTVLSDLLGLFVGCPIEQFR